MNRRKFFGAAVGTVPAIGVLATSPAPRKFLGPMTVTRWLQEGYQGTHRVLLDGEDVTERCRFINDRKGYALLFKAPLTGATERKFGTITIVKARKA